MLNYIFTHTPLKFMIQSLWRDEAFSYLLAKKNLLQIILLTSRDFAPPLYYLTLHFWMKMFGSSEVVMRTLSLVFFWATLYVIFLFLTNILKIKTKPASLYLLLFLINPLLNYYAFEVRMYSMFVFFATLSFYFFARKNDRGYLITTILGLYTHYFMLLAVLSQIIIKLIQRKSFKKILLPLILFLPWVLFYLTQRLPLDQSWLIKPNLLAFSNFPAIIYTGFEFQELDSILYSPLLPIISTVFLFIFMGGLASLLKDRGTSKKTALILAVWTFVPPIIALAVSLYRPVFLPRYLIFSTVGLILLIIFFLKKFRPIQRTVLLIFLISLTLQYNKIQIKHREKADIRRPVSEIKALTKKDDLLYVTSELNFHTAQYYFGEDQVFIYNKTYEEIPWYVGKNLIPKEKVVNTLPMYPQKAFVLKDDLSYEIKSQF